MKNNKLSNTDLIEFFHKSSYLSKFQVEKLEDFCLDAYIENKHSPIRMESLFYAHLKRDSLNKAKHLYEWVEHYYPEYFSQLEDVQKELGPPIEK